jgi:hypothetical protein
MSFSLAGKHCVRPLTRFLGRGDLRCRCGGPRTRCPFPVRRRRPDAPDISRLFERNPHQPVFAFRSQRNTIRHPRRRLGSTRKFVEQNCKPWFQWLGEPYAATFCVYYQRVAWLAKRNRRVHTYQSKGNLRPNARAAPHRFGRLRNQGHESFQIVRLLGNPIHRYGAGFETKVTGLNNSHKTG